MSGKGKPKSKNYSVVNSSIANDEGDLTSNGDEIELSDQQLILPSDSLDSVVFDGGDPMAGLFPSQFSHPAEFTADHVSKYIDVAVFHRRSLDMEGRDVKAICSILRLESQVRSIEAMQALLNQAISQKTENSRLYKRLGVGFAGVTIIGSLFGYVWNSIKLTAADRKVQMLQNAESQLTGALSSNTNCTDFFTYPRYDVHGYYQNETDVLECANSYGAKECVQYVSDFCQFCISTCASLVENSQQLQEAEKESSHSLLITVLMIAGCGIALLLSYKAYSAKVTDRTAKDIMGDEADKLNGLLFQLNTKNNLLSHEVSINSKATVMQYGLEKAKIDSQTHCVALLKETMHLLRLGIFKPLDGINEEKGEEQTNTLQA